MFESLQKTGLFFTHMKPNDKEEDSMKISLPMMDPALKTLGITS
eukprot:JP444888.1.p2 GENE.JP444888.1~~JP444888.1.p2  ORF type:complete len:51 (-),score=8.48 JP444888.1:77-208(-)